MTEAATKIKEALETRKLKFAERQRLFKELWKIERQREQEAKSTSPHSAEVSASSASQE